MRTNLIGVLALAALLPCAAAAAEPAATPDMEKMITKALVDKLGDDAKTIRVAFYDGKAVLSGKVAELPTQELAKEVALWVHGVTKVENQIEPATEKQVFTGKILAESDDASLEGSVKSALKNEIGQYASDLEVEACRGVVSVRGKVPDLNRAKYALAAAEKVPNVKKVIDLIDTGN
jgi:osmotically-inducible protein OsmY